MTPLADLLQQGAANAWLFIPSAMLLGALHGLEPGHSKTMMAAFIVAIRGTIGQAVLLGLCATVSHTAIVWVVALGGLRLFRDLTPARAEPYLQLASGVLILAIAAWMLGRARHEQRAAGHDDHGHARDDAHAHRQAPGESHRQGGHDHADAALARTVAVADGGYQDEHERQHADDIRRRFAGRPVTTPQIALFGITGGLVPCPGAITVLLLCLQLKRVALGSLLVLCFSVGLALTMVASGVIAALGVRLAERRFGGFGELVRKAPYASGILILCVGAYVAVGGWRSLPGAG